MGEAALTVIDTKALDRDAAIAKIRHDSQPENRLPKDLLEAAAYAIACEESGVAHKHNFSGTTFERSEATKKIERRTVQLLTNFQTSSNAVTLDPSEKDPSNKGQLLRVTVDADQLPVSDNLKSIAAEAIQGKIGWMGYGMERTGNTVTLKYPAYTPPAA